MNSREVVGGGLGGGVVLRAVVVVVVVEGGVELDAGVAADGAARVLQTQRLERRRRAVPETQPLRHLHNTSDVTVQTGPHCFPPEHSTKLHSLWEQRVSFVSDPSRCWVQVGVVAEYCLQNVGVDQNSVEEAESKPNCEDGIFCVRSAQVPQPLFVPHEQRIPAPPNPVDPPEGLVTLVYAIEFVRGRGSPEPEKPPTDPGSQGARMLTEFAGLSV